MQMIEAVRENKWKTQHEMYFYIKVMYNIRYVSAINYMPYNLI